MNLPTTPHFLALHGAFTNSGDHLIRDRAVQQLSMLRPDRSVILADRRQPLDPDDPVVQQACAILLLGGPAWQATSHPRIYPLSEPLDRLSPPIIPIGVGWRGDTLDTSRFEFDESTVGLIERIERDGHWGTCRDTTTLSVLQSAGLTRQLMAGCPSWFTPEHLGKAPVVSPEVRTIAYSVGATSSTLSAFGDFERELVRGLRARYPGASVTALFHHPLQVTAGFPARRSEAHATLADRLAADRVEILDVSGESRAMLDVYERVDLHVGFRVHAHLARCAARRPSLLVAEDTRAHAMCRTLGHSAVEGVAVSEDGTVAPRAAALSEVLAVLESADADGWPWLTTVGGTIDATHRAFRWAVERLP